MEGQYNRVYRAKDRVPRPEFGFLLDRLVSQVRSAISPSLGAQRRLMRRNQIASTVETSYTHLPFNDAFSILFFKSQDTESLHKLISEVSLGSASWGGAVSAFSA